MKYDSKQTRSARNTTLRKVALGSIYFRHPSGSLVEFIPRIAVDHINNKNANEIVTM